MRGDEDGGELDVVWQVDVDAEGAVLAFVERGAGDGVVVVLGIGVADLDGAGALDLEAVVEVGAVGQCVLAEAGAGVFDLEIGDLAAGAVGDGGFHVGRAAAGEGEE